MAAAAKKHSDVKFEMATGTIVLKNMAEYFGAGEDTIYLSGMAAGAATKKGIIGYIVPFAIPEVIRHANAFALGAQATHPRAKVRLVWTHSWLDLKKERQAAESLIGSGADVLGQNVDSPSAGQYAESKKIPWVGYDSDARKFAPTQWLTAAVYDWGPYYLRKTRGAMNGTWKTGFYYGNDQGRLHGHRAVRQARVEDDTRRDHGQAPAADQGHVLRVHGPALRPGGQASRAEGEEADGEVPLRHGLARQGRDR